ncbi:hypothetical protein GT021_42145 [Streptomyces sp. SID5470]|uniref:Uncharacterized protein n=2 Tax=Streptomyces TaxID=1883 RepID=B5HS92_STRX2|nr:predicted protein [Streptomyces sviceus ATCC 29083]MYT10775.1 hypothetical protein [Streptomyces sp. SID5470]
MAAHLAAAVVTAASTSQLDTARVLDLALDGTTLALHDCHNVRQGCTTHPVPVWAQPLLRAAAFTHLLAAGERGSTLFADPLGARGLPSLRDFAEHLKLRPPQPPPSRGKPRTGQQQTATIWPVSGAHHARRWTAEENMQGCPQPPGYRT